MDFSNLKGLGSLLFLILFIALLVRNHRKGSAHDKKLSDIKSNRAGDKLYLCNGVEDLGDNLVQFYGEAFGVTIRPGMKIIEPSGMEYVVKEVYRGGSTTKESSTPRSELPPGIEESALVVETSSFNLRAFKDSLKREGIVGMQIK